MNKFLKVIFGLSASIAISSTASADEGTLQSVWVSAESADGITQSEVRANTEIVATRFHGQPEPINVDVEFVETGAIRHLVGAIGIKTGEEMKVFTNAENTDAYFLLQDLTKPGPHIPALNRLLQEYPVNGKRIPFDTVKRMSDPLDKVADDIRWLQTDKGWIADIGIDSEARLLVEFDGFTMARFALLRSDGSDWIVKGPKRPVSDAVLAHLRKGEYAKCAQQALLDAGFDPNGVDGAPGGGARRALAAWGKANGLNLPSFTRAAASQVCQVLIAPATRYEGKRSAVRWTLWPLWSGSVFYNDNSIEMGGVTSEPIGGKANVLQIATVDFGDGLRFGDQKNRDMALPWSPKGSVILHGQDGVDGIQGDPVSYSKYAKEMLRLIDGLSRETGLGSLQQMFSTRGVWFPGLRRALGATDGVGDLPPKPEWQALWSVVDRTDKGQIVAGDISIHTSTPDTRVVMFMEYDPEGERSRLLYASVATLQPVSAAAQSGAFPSLSGEQLISGLFNADCDSATPPVRSLAIAEHNGFSGFPSRLCDGGKFATDIVVWTKTNEDGTQLSAILTLPDGRQIPIAASSFDPGSQSNIFELGLDFNNVSKTCRVVKPSGGIAVFGETACE